MQFRQENYEDMRNHQKICIFINCFTRQINIISMKRIVLIISLLTLTVLIASGQTKQASNSAALTKGKKTIDLINGLKIEIDFNSERETLWITGNTENIPLFITEYIPLDNPNGTGINIGQSYKLDNMFVSIEYKVLEIVDNRVVRIWFRVAALQLKIPEESWI